MQNRDNQNNNNNIQPQQSSVRYYLNKAFSENMRPWWQAGANIIGVSSATYFLTVAETYAQTQTSPVPPGAKLFSSAGLYPLWVGYTALVKNSTVRAGLNGNREYVHKTINGTQEEVNVQEAHARNNLGFSYRNLVETSKTSAFMGFTQTFMGGQYFSNYRVFSQTGVIPNFGNARFFHQPIAWTVPRAKFSMMGVVPKGSANVATAFSFVAGFTLLQAPAERLFPRDQYGNLYLLATIPPTALFSAYFSTPLEMGYKIMIGGNKELKIPPANLQTYKTQGYFQVMNVIYQKCGFRGGFKGLVPNTLSTATAYGVMTGFGIAFDTYYPSVSEYLGNKFTEWSNYYFGTQSNVPTMQTQVPLNEVVRQMSEPTNETGSAPVAKQTEVTRLTEAAKSQDAPRNRAAATVSVQGNQVADTSVEQQAPSAKSDVTAPSSKIDQRTKPVAQTLPSTKNHSVLFQPKKVTQQPENNKEMQQAVGVAGPRSPGNTRK